MHEKQNMGKLSKNKTWKEKHDILLENMDDIIHAHNENIPIKEIAKVYEVSGGCISHNLKLWGVIKKHGIKYLLRKMISEGD